MIVGVDHVALACSGLQSSVGVLERAGLLLDFVEERLVNTPEQQRLLRGCDQTHSIAYLRGRAGIPIELTDYGAVHGRSSSSYQILWAGIPGNAEVATGSPEDWSAVWRVSGLAPSARQVTWASLGAEFWIDAATTGGAVKAVLVPVTDLERAKTFWQSGVGCRAVSSGAVGALSWVRLSTPALWPGWRLDVVVAASSAPPGPVWLDTVGFPCVALLTTALEHDVARLIANLGELVAEPFDVVVNRRRLRIAFVRGAAGELVELVQATGSGADAARPERVATDTMTELK